MTRENKIQLQNEWDFLEIVISDFKGSKKSIYYDIFLENLLSFQIQNLCTLSSMILKDHKFTNL